MSTKEIFLFENFALNPSLFELSRSEVPVSVQPKVLDFLLYLVRHRDRVVTKQELLANLWHGVAVSSASLSYAVMEARKAVGDDGKAQRVIRSVRSRGFRFAAPTRIVQGA